jgi:hypothetical protein
MGWRSTLVVQHDHLHSLAQDQELGKKIEDACMCFGMYMGTDYRRPSDFGFTVVEKNHADANSVLMVHDYCANIICGSPEPTHEAALRAMAEKMGYRLVKKTRRGR